jgi:hypothetical protein
MGFENGLVAHPAMLKSVIHNNTNRNNFDLPKQTSEIEVSIGDMAMFITLAELLSSQLDRTAPAEFTSSGHHNQFPSLPPVKFCRLNATRTKGFN